MGPCAEALHLRLHTTPQVKTAAEGCVQRHCTRHCNAEPRPPCQHSTPPPAVKNPIKQPLLQPVPESVCSRAGACTSLFFDQTIKLSSAYKQNSVLFYWFEWHQAAGPSLGKFLWNELHVRVLFQDNIWNVSRPTFGQVPFSESTHVNMGVKCSKCPRLNHVPTHGARGTGVWW